MLHSKIRISFLCLFFLTVSQYFESSLFAQEIPPSQKQISAKIAIISDYGFGDEAERELGKALAQSNKDRAFTFAISNGDNNQDVDLGPNTMDALIGIPFQELIASGVRIYATTGNHDFYNSRLSQEFEYSKAVAAEERGVGGFVMPSNTQVVRRPGIKWILVNVAAERSKIDFPLSSQQYLEKELCQNRDEWTILTFHYPLWSTGKGDNLELQKTLLPIIEKCPPNIVFNGHAHIGEVMEHKNVLHFTTGNSAAPRCEAPRKTIKTPRFTTCEKGFTVLEIEGNKADVYMFSHAGKLMHHESILRTN